MNQDDLFLDENELPGATDNSDDEDGVFDPDEYGINDEFET